MSRGLALRNPTARGATDKLGARFRQNATILCKKPWHAENRSENALLTLWKLNHSYSRKAIGRKTNQIVLSFVKGSKPINPKTWP